MTKIIFSIISRGSQISFWNYNRIKKFLSFLNHYIERVQSWYIFHYKKCALSKDFFFAKKFIIYYREKYIFSAKLFFFISFKQ